MPRFVLYRLAGIVPLLLVISILTFLLLHLVPGSVADVILGTAATPQTVKELNHQLGLDKPLTTQYLTWLGHALQGNLGTSTKTAEPVFSTISSRLPATLSLTLGATFFAVLVGLGLGVWSSLRPGGVLDRVITTVASGALALPSFWVGILLSVFVGVRLGWLPAGGYIPFSYYTVGWF